MSSEDRTMTDGPILENGERITLSSPGGSEVEHPDFFRSFDDLAERDGETDFPRFSSAESDEQSTTLVGQDTRVRIGNPLAYPYSTIAALWIDIGSGNPYLHGTGVLVSPNLVLTAGHNLYNYLGRSGVRANMAHVYFGLNANSPNATRISVSSRNFITIREWGERRNPAFDYAGIILPTTAGNRFGFMSLQARGIGDYRLGINNLGYPIDCPRAASGRCPPLGTTQWFDQGRVVDVGAHTLSHTIDTAGGVSGGPIFSVHRNSQAPYRVVGLHTRGLPDPTRNLAVRVTSSFVDDVSYWAAEFGRHPIS